MPAIGTGPLNIFLHNLVLNPLDLAMENAGETGLASWSSFRRPRRLISANFSDTSAGGRLFLFQNVQTLGELLLLYLRWLWTSVTLWHAVVLCAKA